MNFQGTIPEETCAGFFDDPALVCSTRMREGSCAADVSPQIPTRSNFQENVTKNEQPHTGSARTYRQKLEVHPSKSVRSAATCFLRATSSPSCFVLYCT